MRLLHASAPGAQSGGHVASQPTFAAQGLPADMPLHYSVIRDWEEFMGGHWKVNGEKERGGIIGGMYIRVNLFDAKNGTLCSGCRKSVGAFGSRMLQLSFHVAGAN